MRCERLVLGLVMVWLLISAVACGAAEPIVETAAGDINLSAADLGSGWTMQQELTKEDLFTDAPGHVLDANQRTFVSQEVPGKVVVSHVFSTKSVASAKREMEGDLVGAMTSTFEEQASEGTMEEVEPPGIGEDDTMLEGTGTISGVPMEAFVVAFRKANVFAMVFLMGPTESATTEGAVGYAQELETRIQ